MNFLKKYKFDLVLTLILVVIGQVIFLAFSDKFTTPRYEGRAYGTIGNVFRTTDLHKLNDAAHYFVNTISGWTKFPSFNADVREFANLPADAVVGAYTQERQNMIVSVNSSQQLNREQLEGTLEFIQSKLDEYNQVNDTGMSLSNLDYEVLTLQKSYAFGAAVALLVAVVLGLGVGFVRRELL